MREIGARCPKLLRANSYKDTPAVSLLRKKKRAPPIAKGREMGEKLGEKLGEKVGEKTPR